MFISVHKNITAIEIDNNNSKCEVIWTEVQTQGKPITIGAFYRPPSAKESSFALCKVLKIDKTST